MAEVVLSVVETDLRLLASEMKKAEGPMTNFMGILHHSELPAVKEATARALEKVKSVEGRHTGLPGVQQALAQEILAPFTLACETKYAKLACIALSTFQKLLANDAVSVQGRVEIIKAFQAAERLSDESVKLRTLQASLTIFQNQTFADEQEGVRQLLSLLFRIYHNNKNNLAVHSTAAATIRQAVALVFEHSVARARGGSTGSQPAALPAGGASPATASLRAAPSTQSARTLHVGEAIKAASSTGLTYASTAASVSVAASPANGLPTGPPVGREQTPAALLEDLVAWLCGKEPVWLRCPKPDRTFLLETLEGVLLQRANAIQRLPALAAVVQTKVAPVVCGLLESATDRQIDPNDVVDCRLVVRCAAAFVRRHHGLAPDRAAAMVARLGGAINASPPCARWQRFMVLQALRPLLAEPSLVYRLHFLSPPASSEAAGSSAAPATAFVTPAAASASAAAAVTTSESGGSLLPPLVSALSESLRRYVRTVVESPDDDVVAALGNLYQQRALGARDAVQETEAFGSHLQAGSEVVIAHLALECVLGLVAATEALTELVVVPAEPGMPSPQLVQRDCGDVRCAAVAALVSLQWRAVLGVVNPLLARAAHELLVQQLMRGLQTLTFCAGALKVVEARDALLAALCAHTLLPPGEEDLAVAAGAGAQGTAGQPGQQAASGAQAGGGSAGGGAAGGGEDRSTGGTIRRNATALSPSASTTAPALPAPPASPLSAPPAAPGFLTTLLERNAVRVVLTPRNTAALRALFGIAHRLADVLGGRGWAYVVDCVNALDRILAAPTTTTAAYLLEAAESEGGAPPGLPTATSIAPPGTAAAAAPGSAPPTGSGAALPAAPSIVPMPFSPAAAAMSEAADGDGFTAAQRELRVLASAADQLFEHTHHMSPEGVVSLLSALSEISHRTLQLMGYVGPGPGAAAAAAAAGAPASGEGSVSGGLLPGGPGGSGVAPAPGPVRLWSLQRMVDTLLHNLWRIQDLWGIFLAHALEVLRSPHAHVRAAALDALDRTITSALSPDLHVPDKFTAPLTPTDTTPAASTPLPGSGRPSRDFGEPALAQPAFSPSPSPAPCPAASLASTPIAGAFASAAASASSSVPSSMPSMNTLITSHGTVPTMPTITAAAAQLSQPPTAHRGVQQAAGREDVERMLLVALDSLYREEGRNADVRRGLLRVALHVLQHHGDGLTRGWVPLLRLCEAVTERGGARREAQEIGLGFQVVELLASDYLASSLPKEHVPKALEVVARFAAQDTILNVSLTAITMLWNATDHLARSRGTLSKQQGAHSRGQQQQPPGAPRPAAAPVALTPGPFTAKPAPPASTLGASLFGSSSSPFGPSTSSAGMGQEPGEGRGERAMSPAFAAALSFAHGTRVLPSSSSPSPAGSRAVSAQSSMKQGSVAAGAATGAPAAPPPSPLGTLALASADGGYSSGYGGALHDLDETESIAMLMIAFRALKELSLDPRPETRNAAIRTLFMAVGSHGGKFPAATWRELFWGQLLPLLRTVHATAGSSSQEEAAAVELGKERGGAPVLLLVHHSRNSAQKQWDESTVLALGGCGRVLRAHLPVLAGLGGWGEAWGEIMKMAGGLLSTCRKGVCLAAAALLTTVLGAHGAGPHAGQGMWEQALAAIDRGVAAQAAPDSPAPLQARAELLTCITTLYGIRRPALTSRELLLFVRWLDRFARYPAGRDDTSPIHFTTLGPIQKAALAGLAALPPLPAAAAGDGAAADGNSGGGEGGGDVWPAVLGVLCDMLRPFTTLGLRQHAQQAAALQQVLATTAAHRRFAFATTSAADAPGPVPGSAVLAAGAAEEATEATVADAAAEAGAATPAPGPGPPPPAVDPLQEARALSPLWMARVVELLAAWYRDQVTWQVRVATFPVLVAALSECMAARHAGPGLASQGRAALPPQLAERLGSEAAACPEPLDELWRTAARAFVSVVQTGLPSINICCGQAAQQVPASTWPALARAFEMFLLARSLPPLAAPAPAAQRHLEAAAREAATALLGPGAAAADTAVPAPAAPVSPEQLAADGDVAVAVLDCLADTVLAACQHAPVEVRRALVHVLDAGAAGAPLLAAGGPAPSEAALPPTARLSHVCLAKLYVLSSRGQDPPGADGWEPPAARSQLEVAQLALPVLVSRCEAVMTDYCHAERRSRLPPPAAPPGSDAAMRQAASPRPPTPQQQPGGASPEPACAPQPVPPALADRARHVMELLGQLRVLPAVSDALLPSRPHLRFWLEVGRARRAHAALPLPAAAAALPAPSPLSLADGGATTPGGSIGSGASGIVSPAAGSVAGLLAPHSPRSAPSRQSSSGTDSLVPPAGAMAQVQVNGAEAPAPGGGIPVRPSPSSSSFFSRTYNSTGTLLSSAMAVATGVSSGGGSTSAPTATAAAGPQGGPRRSSVGERPIDGRAPPPGLTRNVSIGGGRPQQWAKEQPHLVALYGVLCECITSADPAAREAAQGMLTAVGAGLGLCAGFLPLAASHKA